jgi:hypothetical protein
MAEDLKSKIIAWFNGPQDFDEGMELLSAVSKKSKVIGKLGKRGESRGTYEKLVWELNKVAGLAKIPTPSAKIESKIVKLEPVKTEKPAGKGKTETKEKFSLIGKRDIADFPTVIQKIVRENSALYMQRGKKHAALVRLGDGNDAETVSQRTIITGEIKLMSDRLEVLFDAWDGFEKTGVVPDPEDLWPLANYSTASAAATKTPETLEEMKTEKKNLQSSITKDRNLLLYGNKIKPKDGKEAPMPADSPKRVKLEKRIARKEQEIKDLDMKIAKMS